MQTEYKLVAADGACGFSLHALAQRNGASSRAGSFLRSSSGQAVPGRHGVRGAGTDRSPRRGLVILDVAGSGRKLFQRGALASIPGVRSSRRAAVSHHAAARSPRHDGEPRE